MRTEDRTDRMLDEALEMTFPASDPISVYLTQIDNVVEKAPRREEAGETLPFAA